MKRNFREMLEVQWALANFACVGLDSDLNQIPKSVHGRRIEDRLYNFNCAIVDATYDLVCAFKPNIAFYEAHGACGFYALRAIVQHINQVAPKVPVILDAKRADIGNTNSGYAEMAFEYLGVDAITVHPYLGAEALKPFLARTDKGVIVLCRTSNPGAGEFQDLAVEGQGPLYQVVARRVRDHWNQNGNCVLVVGATFPEELREVRGLVGDMPILIPGIGAQGGDVEKTVAAGKDSRGQGMIVNSSRGIIFASKGEDFAEAAHREAEKLHTLINHYR